MLSAAVAWYCYCYGCKCCCKLLLLSIWSFHILHARMNLYGSNNIQPQQHSSAPFDDFDDVLATLSGNFHLHMIFNRLWLRYSIVYSSVFFSFSLFSFFIHWIVPKSKCKWSLSVCRMIKIIWSVCGSPPDHTTSRDRRLRCDDDESELSYRAPADVVGCS